MYASNPPANYEKYMLSGLPPPLAFGQQASTGIPVSTTSQYYSESETSRLQATVDPESKNKEPWSSGLFACFSDWRNCCITCWCPCATFGRIAEIVDKGSSSCGVNGALYTLIACVTCCPCCYSCFYRSKMRQQYAIKKRPCGDCLVHCFCECCALCQEHRELKIRGYDLELGWHGNVEKKNRSLEMASMAPVVEGGMSM